MNIKNKSSNDMKPSRFLTAICLLATALAVGGCTQDEGMDGNGTLFPEGEYSMTFTTGTLQVVATPASRTTTDNNWDGVTSVAVQVNDAIKEYRVTVSNNNQTSTLEVASGEPFYWQSTADKRVCAWWPFTAGSLAKPDVVVKADQNSENNFQASDCIEADEMVTFANSQLTFKHRTAKMVVTLKAGGGVSVVESAVLTFENLSTEKGNPAVIMPYKNSTALLAPQTIPEGTKFIKVELNGNTYYYTSDTAITLAAGQQYNYIIAVNNTGLVVTVSNITAWDDTSVGGSNGEIGLDQPLP